MDVLWTPRAMTDVEDIQRYVAADSPSAAFGLVSRIRERAEVHLPDNPMIGRIGRDPETRELVVRDTPYIIVYRLRRAIEIIAVVHGAREWPRQF